MMRGFLLVLVFATSAFSQHPVAHKCGFGQGMIKQDRLERSGDRDVYDFDESILDQEYVSPAGYFRIHYTLSGNDSVANDGSLNPPPFVIEAARAADFSYGVITQEFGFNPPPGDNSLDGPELDIYIRNWRGSVYGMTYFGGYTPSSTFPGYPSYLVIDNDYSEPNYATSGIAALQVTVAHEFFHMVQLGYAHPAEFDYDNLNWYEISSVWMEEVCYPDIDDYHAYVASNFGQSNFPDLDGPGAYSYGHGIFGQVLDLEYGHRDGKHIILDVWENLDGNHAFAKLGETLANDRWNSSLTDALGKYALYNVFTGSRAIPGEYYPDAASLPEVRTTQYTLPLDISAQFQFDVQDLQIRYKRFNIPTLSDFVVKAENLTSSQRLYLTAHKVGVQASLKGALSNYWIPCVEFSSLDYLILPVANGSLSDAASFSIVFEGGMIELDNAIQAIWPNPHRVGDGEIHLNAILSTAGPLIVSLYDILGREVYRSHTANPVEGVFELVFMPPPDLAAGLYILQLRSGSVRLNQKVTLFK